LEEIIKEGWIIATHAEKIGNKDKLSSLALIKDTYNIKMDLLTNASLLQDSIRFIEQNKEKIDPGKLPEPIDKKRSDGIPSQVLDNDIQRSTEDSISEQYNEVF
jgi:hypothetical protein